MKKTNEVPSIWDLALSYLKNQNSVLGVKGAGRFYPKDRIRMFFQKRADRVFVCQSRENGNGWDTWGSVYIDDNGVPMRTRPMHLHDDTVKHDRPSTVHFWRDRPLEKEYTPSPWWAENGGKCEFNHPQYSKLLNAGVTFDQLDLLQVESEDELTELAEAVLEWVGNGGSGLISISTLAKKFDVHVFPQDAEQIRTNPDRAVQG